MQNLEQLKAMDVAPTNVPHSLVNVIFLGSHVVTIHYVKRSEVSRVAVASQEQQVSLNEEGLQRVQTQVEAQRSCQHGAEHDGNDGRSTSHPPYSNGKDELSKEPMTQ